jgi:hypothetical protein
MHTEQSFVHFVFCAVSEKRPVVPSAGKGRPPRPDAPLDPQPQPQPQAYSRRVRIPAARRAFSPFSGVAL